MIRPATAADLPAINAIYNFYVATSPATFDLDPTSEAWRREWFPAREAGGFPVLVAEVGGEVGGWCCLYQWSPKKAYAKTADESIYIADAVRGQGLGKALLRGILDEARVLGMHVVMAGIVGCQEASLALHRSLGFVEAGRYQHMGFKLGEWRDVLVPAPPLGRVAITGPARSRYRSPRDRQRTLLHGRNRTRQAASRARTVRTRRDGGAPRTN